MNGRALLLALGAVPPALGAVAPALGAVLVALGAAAAGCAAPSQPSEPQIAAPITAPPRVMEAVPLLPDGRVAMREVALARGSICVLAVDGVIRCYGPAYSNFVSMVLRQLPIPPAREIFGVDDRSYALTQKGDVFAWAAGSPPLRLELHDVTDLAVAGDAICVVDASGAACRAVNDDRVLFAVPATEGPRAVSARIGERCIATATDVRCEGAEAARHAIPGVVELAASTTRTCARSREGVVTCWQGPSDDARPFGEGAFASLDATIWGICALPFHGPPRCVAEEIADPTAEGVTPLDEVLPARRGVTSVALAKRGACFVEAGVLTCWGEADPLNRLKQPTAIDLGDLASLGAARAVAVGVEHACVLGTDDVVRCWGANMSGALGVGDRDDRLGPERVLAVPPVDAIAAGPFYTCFLTKRGGAEEGGRVFCAGAIHSDERLPDCRPRVCPVAPALVTTGVKDLSVGLNFACVVDADGGPTGGGVRCWGDNTHGELGTGDATDSATPRPVVDASGAPIRGARKVFAGRGHACAILEGADLVCWGSDETGEMGLALGTESRARGASSAFAAPVPMPGRVVDVSDRCVVLEGGEARCWGWLPNQDFSVTPARVGACGVTELLSGGCHLGPTGVACRAPTRGAASRPRTTPPIVDASVSSQLLCTVDATHAVACATRDQPLTFLVGEPPSELPISPSDVCPADPTTGALAPIVQYTHASATIRGGASRDLTPAEVTKLATAWEEGTPSERCYTEDPPVYLRLQTALFEKRRTLEYLGRPCNALRDYTLDRKGPVRKLTPAGDAFVRSIRDSVKDR